MSTEGKRTILLVEDEPILAMSQKMMLQKHGYEVFIAPNGEHALSAVKNSPEIDLILMDIDLGKGMDGTETARIILQDQDIPVVFCSSHTEPEIVSKTEKITSYGYVVKGSTVTVLDASIKMAFKLFQAKRQIVTSQRLQQAMASNIGDVIVIIDRAGLIRYESPNIFALFGWNPADRIGRSSTENVHPDDLEAVLEFTGQISTEPNAKGTIELRSRCADGRFVWIELTVANLLSDPDIQGLLGNYHNITKRKETEQELLTSKRLLEQTFEQSPVPMALVSMPDGIMRFINPATLRFLGIEDEASRIGIPLLEMPVTWQDLDLQGNPGALEDLPLVRSMAGIKTDSDERCIIRKDGSVRYELIAAH